MFHSAYHLLWQVHLTPSYFLLHQCLYWIRLPLGWLLWQIVQGQVLHIILMWASQIDHLTSQIIEILLTQFRLHLILFIIWLYHIFQTLIWQLLFSSLLKYLLLKWQRPWLVPLFYKFHRLYSMKLELILLNYRLVTQLKLSNIV